MSPWEIFVNVSTWIGITVGLFVILFIAWLVMDALCREAVKAATRNRRDLNNYLTEARAVADKYRDETAPEFREGFLAGTRWGWGYFTRLRKRQ